MRKSGLALAAAILIVSAGMAFGGEGYYGHPGRRVCWNPPDSIEPGYVPCGPRTGLNAPRRVDGTFGVHPDEWFFNLPISPPGVRTGSTDVGTPPGWDK